MTPFRAPWSTAPTMVGTAAHKPTIVSRYGNPGAFQEPSESWDRPSVPTGPSLGDGRTSRPTGGKPDWYRMISDKQHKATRLDEARSIDHEYLHEVPIASNLI
jgi:hypothetical protein